MPIQRLNHAVLYVRDVGKSVAFYCDLLGFRPVMDVPVGQRSYWRRARKRSRPWAVPDRRQRACE